MYMKDWVEKLDAFLQFNEQDILKDNGKVSHAVAVGLAEAEYIQYQLVQDQNYVSDFDREVEKLLQAKKGKKKD